MDVAAVDEWWAAWLGTTVDQLHAGGVVATGSVDHVGVVETAQLGGALVYGPARWLGGFLDAVEPPPSLDRGLDDVRSSLGDGVVQALGPAWYGYADRASLVCDELVCDEGVAVRPLGPADAGLAETLRTQVSAAEWDGAGMNTGADFGIVVDGALLAAANLGAWRGMPSIGVLTSPAHRGRGLARQVVRAAACHALTDAAHVQYRAWETNAASIAVAEHVGFAFYARAVVVDVAA